MGKDIVGMYDSFFFKDGVLPDNKVAEDHEFQTKDLYCNLDRYYVGRYGIVTREILDAGGEYIKDTESINDSVEVYSHEFLWDGDDLTTRKYLGCKYQIYKIIILDNDIKHIRKIYQSGYGEGKRYET